MGTLIAALAVVASVVVSRSATVEIRDQAGADEAMTRRVALVKAVAEGDNPGSG